MSAISSGNADNVCQMDNIVNYFKENTYGEISQDASEFKIQIQSYIGWNRDHYYNITPAHWERIERRPDRKMVTITLCKGDDSTFSTARKIAQILIDEKIVTDTCIDNNLGVVSGSAEERMIMKD
jgi:hypothetical protein